MSQIPVLAGAATDEARDVSYNGDLITGLGGTFPSINGYRWSAIGGTTTIPGIGDVQGASSNGVVVVGRTTDADTQARRWSLATGTQGFGPLTGTPLGLGTTASANAANADGSIIIGYARVTISVTPPVPQVILSPFIWDAVNGARTMPLANGSLLDGTAHDITPDGNIIVGFANSPQGSVFRWTQTGGYQFIQPLILPGSSGTPRTSADGNSIIAGLNYWSPSTGVITIQQLLTSAGCDFTGWTLTGAVGISDDGRTIAGNGTSPTGQTQAWIATVPAPAAAPLLVLAAFARTQRRRT